MGGGIRISILDDTPNNMYYLTYHQEPDKLNDDHLYRFLQDLKKPSPVLKRLKIIKGTLKLDISVAPEQVSYR